jgi:hypothetical protein
MLPATRKPSQSRSCRTTSLAAAITARVVKIVPAHVLCQCRSRHKGDRIMRKIAAFLLCLFSLPCVAQKWVDDNGKVYYGDPPAGINVRQAPMTGGTVSSVKSQAPASMPSSSPATSRSGALGIPPGIPAADAHISAAAKKDMAQAQRDNAAKFEQSAKDLKQKQQEQYQESLRRQAIQQRQQDMATCRAMGRC